MVSLPTLIIVTGLPCTGKTTLARSLAAQLALPLLSKDTVKETLFDTLGWGERDWSKRLSLASTALLFRFIEAQLAARQSCMVESNFDPEEGTRQLRELQARYPFLPIQIICVTKGEVLLERFRARAAAGERHPGHRDDILGAELAPLLAQGRVAPLALEGELIEVDTSDFAAVNVAALSTRLRAGRSFAG